MRSHIVEYWKKAFSGVRDLVHSDLIRQYWFPACVTVFILAIACIAAPPNLRSFPTRPSHEGGTVWVTAFAAIGTLAAVWASFDLNRRVEARERQSKKDTEAQEERIRHDNVRPVLTAQAYWRPGALLFRVYNEGSFPALNLRLGVRRPSITDITTWRTSDRGVTLRPHSQQKSQDLDPAYVYEFDYEHPGLADEQLWQLQCHFGDILGKYWLTHANIRFGVPNVWQNQWHWLDMLPPQPSQSLRELNANQARSINTRVFVSGGIEVFPDPEPDDQVT